MVAGTATIVGYPGGNILRERHADIKRIRININLRDWSTVDLFNFQPFQTNRNNNQTLVEFDLNYGSHENGTNEVVSLEILMPDRKVTIFFTLEMWNIMCAFFQPLIARGLVTIEKLIRVLSRDWSADFNANQNETQLIEIPRGDDLNISEDGELVSSSTDGSDSDDSFGPEMPQAELDAALLNLYKK